jgi:hypothetical protein
MPRWGGKILLNPEMDRNIIVSYFSKSQKTLFTSESHYKYLFERKC